MFFLVFGIALLIKYEIGTWYVRYAVTNHRVVASVGILHEDFKGTTYSYIADTYFYQSFFDRILNIGSIKIKTTGSEERNIVLDKVSKPIKIEKLIHDNIIRIHHMHYDPQKYPHRN